MTGIIDSDEHLYEKRTLWAENIDPGRREDALAIVDDDLGYAWLTWRGGRISLADVQMPGDTAGVGHHRQRRRQGLPSAYSFDEALPDDYWEPIARARRVMDMGFDSAVVFPNFGLLWERHLSGCPEALTANMGAWNRWCADVVSAAGGRLHPVAHLTLCDIPWLEAQLAALAAAGVRLAMIAPAAVGGRPLSHPEHDRVWRSFVDHGVTPVFHVADQPRVLDDAWYGDYGEDSLAPVVESILLWAPPALAITDLIVNGTLARHPELRIAVVELSSVWVPQYLLMLDGGWDFTRRINGRPPVPLDLRPSEYFTRQVRVSSFSYELPDRLIAESADLYMCCSDYPHAEGTADPLPDYAAADCRPDSAPGLFHDNIAPLVGSRGT